jgi:hypothetical protein
VATGTASAGRSELAATEIFRWSTRIPRCAINALSMLRTVCFGVYSDVVSTWISSTAPFDDATIFADNTPGSVVNNSSARRIGSTLPAIGVCEAPVDWGEKLTAAGN